LRLTVKGQGHWEWERNVKIIFCAYHRQKWIDLRQTETKLITGPFYIYLRIHFTGGNYLFCDNLHCIICLLSGGQSTWQRPPGRYGTYLFNVP